MLRVKGTHVNIRYHIKKSTERECKCWCSPALGLSRVTEDLLAEGLVEIWSQCMHLQRGNHCLGQPAPLKGDKVDHQSAGWAFTDGIGVFL